MLVRPGWLSRRPVADLKRSTRELDRLAPGVHVKQREAGLVRRDLRVIAAGRQCSTGFRCQARRFTGVLDLAHEHAGRQRLRCGIRRIEHDEPARPEHALQPSAEGLRHACSRLVAAAKIVEELRREFRCGERCLQLGQGSGDRVVQPYPCHRPACAPGMLPIEIDRSPRSTSRTLHVFTSSQSWSSASTQNTATAGTSMFGPDAFGQLQRRQRLEQREKRATEQSRLLTGDHGHRSRVGEGGGSGERIRGCITSSLLRLKDLDERVALPSVTRRARDGVAPCQRVSRVSGKEVRQARIVECVVGCEASDPGETANLDGKPAARGCVPPRCGAGRLGGHTRQELCPSRLGQGPSLVLQCLAGARRARSAMRFRGNEHDIFVSGRIQVRWDFTCVYFCRAPSAVSRKRAVNVTIGRFHERNSGTRRR